MLLDCSRLAWSSSVDFFRRSFTGQKHLPGADLRRYDGSALRASALLQRLGPSGLAEAAGDKGASAGHHDCSNLTRQSLGLPALAQPLFSMLFDRSRLVRSSSVEVHRGGTKPEVVFPNDARCRTRVFSTDSDCLRLAQSISVKFHRGGTKPEVVFRSGA